MSLRRRVRFVVDRLGERSGLLRLFERSMRGELTILTYHRVLPAGECADYPFPSMAMDLDAFRDQVRWLADRFTVLPVGEALGELQKGASPDRPLVSLTFDDGYRDNARLAAPVLEDSGLRATFFVTAGLAGTGELLWFDRAALTWEREGPPAVRAAVARLPGRATGAPELATRRDWVEFLKTLDPDRCTSVLEAIEGAGGPPRDERFGLMTAGEVRALADAGHEIASHSLTHPVLTRLEDEGLRRELLGSRERLEAWLGRPVRGFAYPNGDHDARTVEAARSAGYGYACTARPRRHRRGGDPFTLGRIDVTGTAVAGPGGGYHELSFRGEVSGFHEVLR